MKFMGVSLTTVLVLLFAVWIGTRYPNLFGSLPILGKIIA